MEQWRLLVVDDEPLNLEIIREYLDDPRYAAEFVLNAERALERLEAAAPPFDLMVLDRSLPGMDGLELLRRIKADTRFRAMPVIMQTAASAPEQVREGVEAGAYYYLTKPYEPAALVAIVRGALADLEEVRKAVRASSAQVEALGLMERGEFTFRSLDDVHALSPILAALSPSPEAAAIGLTELMINAVEHGNLGISYQEKAQLMRDDRWADEIARRLQLPDFRDRTARLTVERRPDELVFTVADEGAGFNVAAYLEFDPGRAFDPNGRGIAMARQLCFSRIEYRGRGNIVEAAIAWPSAAQL